MREAVATNDKMKKSCTVAAVGLLSHEALSCPPSSAASAKVQPFCKALKESPGFLQN